MRKIDTTRDEFSELQKLIHYWFVQYNPLYFFSALSILIGVLLINRELPATGWVLTKVALAGVSQIYELLVILASALLFRTAGERRAAVILGLLAVFFLFDCTCQIEILTTLDRDSWWPALLLIVFTSLKLVGLIWAFRLKVDSEFYLVPILGMTALVVTSKLLAMTVFYREILYLLITWVGAFLMAVVIWQRPKIECAVKLDDWGQTVLRRAIKASWLLWGGLFLGHLISLSILFDLRISVAHFVPFLLLWPLATEQEELSWTATCSAIILSFVQPPTMVLTALMGAFLLGWLGWQRRQYRLFTGALMAIYLAGWQLGVQNHAPPQFQFVLNIVMATLLIWLGWKLRFTISMLIGLLLGMLSANRYARTMSALNWGVTLMVLGFVSLALGVSFNLRRARQVRED